jgi:cell division protein FtsQ
VESGDSHDPRSGVTTQRSPKNGSLVWEDDASAESRFRRVQQVTPNSRRNLPGMPLEMQDPDDEDLPRSRRRFDGPPIPWWRPQSTVGRVFLGLGVLFVVGILGTAVFLFKTYLERDSRFRITGATNIQATGLGEVTRSEMLPVFGEDIGRNVFFVPLNQRRKQLEQIPWVEKATVMRLLPDQLRVAVVERHPVAFVRQGQQIGLVDPNGVLLTMPAAMMTKHHYSFPVVTGIDPGQPLTSRRARMAVYQRLLGELDSTGQHLSEQISEIDLTDPEDARVLMPEQGADILAHFGDEQFLSRYQRYKAHIAEWRQQYPRLAAVDLRYEQQVVLQMTPGSGGTQTAVSTGDGQPMPTESTQAAAPPSKPSAGVKSAATPAKSAAKAPVRKAAAKPKSAREKNRKRAVSRRAAATSNRQKQAPKPHPAIVTQGQ